MRHKKGKVSRSQGRNRVEGAHKFVKAGADWKVCKCGAVIGVAEWACGKCGMEIVQAEREVLKEESAEAARDGKVGGRGDGGM